MARSTETGGTITDGTIEVNGRKWGFAPRRFSNGHKTYIYWVAITYTITGQREKKTFKNEAAAGRYLRESLSRYASDKQAQQILQRRIGEKARKLSTDSLLDAARALEVLQGRATLHAVALEYMDRHPIGPSETVEEAKVRYIDEMRRENARPSSIADKNVKLGVFCKDYGPRPVASIDDALLVKWCKDKKFSASTALAYANAVRTLMNFHAGRKRKRRQQDERLPITWPVDQVKLLFSTCEHVSPELIPAMTLLWFCGLRPAEMLRIDWRHIDLNGKTVHLLPGISKTRTSRVVDIPDNAVEWLKAYKGEGRVVSSTGAYRKQRAEVMKVAGISEWDKDVPRHTYATTHYKTHENLERTMEQLGHFGESNTFRRHYKGQPITREQAAEYWKIRPGTASNRQMNPMESTA